MPSEPGRVFSKDQLKAIQHTTGPAMVIAGPGSGKTTVTVSRIRYLIQSGSAAPGEILVITFTSAAAAEMRSRFMALCGAQAPYDQVTFGTFHSVFFSILKEFSGRRGLRPAETAESIRILRETVQTLYPNVNVSSDYFSYLLGEISRRKNTLSGHDPDGKCRTGDPRGSGQAAGGLGPGGPPVQTSLLLTKASEINRLIQEYDRRMRAAGLLDFDDMLLECLRLLRRDPGVLDALRRRYRFFMADEFQDINAVQFEILRLLAAPQNHLFVVGDDDQSIYGFRGSDPAIMLSFGSMYPRAKIYRLFTNYRSDRRIILAAARLIRHNRSRFEKKYEAVRDGGAKPSVLCFGDPGEEAVYVADSIAAADPQYKSFGILYRNHKNGSAAARELQRRAVSPEYAEKYAGKDISMHTFHASKGLEFDVVYIIAANETKLSEEERRLFYVAMTRARKALHISYTKYVYTKKVKPSRFLREAGLGRLPWTGYLPPLRVFNALS